MSKKTSTSSDHISGDLFAADNDIGAENENNGTNENDKNDKNDGHDDSEINGGEAVAAGAPLSVTANEPRNDTANEAPPAKPEAGHSGIAPADYAAQRYLEYAMSVVTGRALPANADGQKPVQRRILYAMHKMGLYKSPRHVKSARVVGEVIGKYHPHGDSSVYDAMVRMAQNWSLRYPVVDGQGNFGSRDGDGAAAMRYTEARLTPIAELLLAEIDEGTTEWRANYDGVNDEPCLLPARLPFVLLNGASGIAVGMATEIPPHNLREVADAARELITHPQWSREEQENAVFRLIPGPDFSGGAQIISSATDIRSVYHTGRGSLRVRSRYHFENLARGQWRLVFTELPPGVSAAGVMAEIENCSNPQTREKSGKKTLSPEQLHLKNAFLNAIANSGVRDESGKDCAVRLVIEPGSSRQNKEDLVRLLLAHTALENNTAINLTVLGINGSPQQASLWQILDEWCRWRLQTVTRRTQHRLLTAEKRIHILEGRQQVLLDIDRVIAVIREADDPKSELMAHFGLSEIQAEDILEIRLRQLARLEGIKIGEELAKLRATAAALKHLLHHDDALRQCVAEEIAQDAKQYGDDRRTLIEESEKITPADARELSIVNEPVTLIVSRHGWLRSRSGHNTEAANLSFRSGDELLALLTCRSVDQLVILDQNGRAYALAAADIPGGKGDGVPAASLIDFQDGGTPLFALIVQEDQHYLLASAGGYGFRIKGSDIVARSKNGKALLSVTAPDMPAVFIPDPGSEELLLSTRDQRHLIFAAAEIRTMSKGKGLKLIAAQPGKAALLAIEGLQRDDYTRAQQEKLTACAAARGSTGFACRLKKKSSANANNTGNNGNGGDNGSNKS